jgi:hypothetical protein
MPILENLDAAIATFDADFTTHQIILILAKQNQRDYISALAQENGEQPFKDLHAKIGKALSARSDLKLCASVPSVNIFGDKCTSPVWQITRPDELEG